MVSVPKGRGIWKDQQGYRDRVHQARAMAMSAQKNTPGARTGRHWPHCSTLWPLTQLQQKKQTSLLSRRGLVPPLTRSQSQTPSASDPSIQPQRGPISATAVPDTGPNMGVYSSPYAIGSRPIAEARTAPGSGGLRRLCRRPPPLPR